MWKREQCSLITRYGRYAILGPKIALCYFSLWFSWQRIPNWKKGTWLSWGSNPRSFANLATSLKPPLTWIKKSLLKFQRNILTWYDFILKRFKNEKLALRCLFIQEVSIFSFRALSLQGLVLYNVPHLTVPCPHSLRFSRSISSDQHLDFWGP